MDLPRRSGIRDSRLNPSYNRYVFTLHNAGVEPVGGKSPKVGTRAAAKWLLGPMRSMVGCLNLREGLLAFTVKVRVSAKLQLTTVFKGEEGRGIFIWSVPWLRYVWCSSGKRGRGASSRSPLEAGSRSSGSGAGKAYVGPACGGVAAPDLRRDSFLGHRPTRYVRGE